MSLSNSRKHSTNLAGRMGRWSAHHRKIAIFGWLALVFAAFAIGTFVVGAKEATSASGPGEWPRHAKHDTSTALAAGAPGGDSSRPAPPGKWTSRTGI